MNTIIRDSGYTQTPYCDPASRSRYLGRRTRCAVITLFGMCLATGLQASDTPAQTGSLSSRAGYSAGYAFGGRLAELQRQDPGVELEAVFQGILDALSGAEPRLSAEAMDATLQELKDKRTADSSGSGKTPPATAPARRGGFIDDFAALNAKREGVVTLPSGVQYEILRAGSGRRPAIGDAVHVSYQASLTNGAVFDSTLEDDQPARLQLEEIAVPGLKEALLLMNQGARWRVVIPPGMGFRNSGNNMLRRRDLIYDIELVSIGAPADAAEQSDSAATPGATPARPAAAQP
ncbi:MAG: FKBP-type peptidyl-prolyl cis-trans isomerase [Gammaproteobacteria bacterium]